jgi:uncharacterized protein YbbC (DUF1343 family)
LASPSRRIVQTGLECLIADKGKLLDGQQLGLIINQSSVAANFRSTLEVVSSFRRSRVKAVFAPEHGLFGSAQDMIAVGAAALPKLKIHSLYGKKFSDLSPSPRMLEGLTALLFDLQDLGSRYYTFLATMVLAMKSAAKAGLQVFVLDRPNPLGGNEVEGPTVEEGYESFVGLYPAAVRHGLTAGEIAMFANETLGICCDLTVVLMNGWRRAMHHDQTGLPWVMPSPNMPTLETALVYPGLCLLEGTNLSEGRGTTRPFELSGAPWLNEHELAATLTKLKLPGVAFRPAVFEPTFHKWANEKCRGIQTHVVDRRCFKPFLTGIAVLWAARKQDQAKFKWRTREYEFVKNIPAIDLLAGGSWLRQGLEAEATVRELGLMHRASEKAFQNNRKPFLLYG